MADYSTNPQLAKMLLDQQAEINRLRAELEAARAEPDRLDGPQWRWRAFGPNNEIFLDPSGLERRTMAGLGGWRFERQPVYVGKWESAVWPEEGQGDD